MGYIALPRRLFLWSMALIYMSAFVSLYMQIPGKPRSLVSCTLQLQRCVSFLVLRLYAPAVIWDAQTCLVWNFLQTALWSDPSRAPCCVSLYVLHTRG